jgi:hypothetical protein
MKKFQKLWEYFWIKIVNIGLDIDFEIEDEDLREDFIHWEGSDMLQLLIAKVGYVVPK